MATDLRLPLDVSRLVAIVLFLIVGGLFFRTFFHNYYTVPARDATNAVLYRESVESESERPPGMSPSPQEEQWKQRLSRNVKRHVRAQHSLAIWGSFAMVCLSIIAAVIAGLPMLLERRA